ncbi:unnamed protein product, partial [Mesorhabditis spiculigera]
MGPGEAVEAADVAISQPAPTLRQETEDSTGSSTNTVLETAEQPAKDEGEKNNERASLIRSISATSFKEIAYPPLAENQLPDKKRRVKNNDSRRASYSNGEETDRSGALSDEFDTDHHEHTTAYSFQHEPIDRVPM